MRKVLSIFFLVTYLFSTTELSELLKFPALVEHYFDHKEKSPDITVFEFLTLHYSGNHLEGHPHDDDYEKDQKLPFIVHTDVMTTVFIINQYPIAGYIKKYLQEEDTKVQPLDDIFRDSNILSSIWQPPQFC